jgi:hypothetical protein
MRGEIERDQEDMVEMMDRHCSGAKRWMMIDGVLKCHREVKMPEQGC